MKSRLARLGVLLAAVAGLMATMTPPASATTVKEGVFVGEATTGPLGYPCTPIVVPDLTTTPPDLPDCVGEPTVETKDPFKGVPTVNVYPAGGNTVGFSFSSTTCVKVSASVKPLGGTDKTGATALCHIQAAGLVTGFCGLSTGKGVATLTNPDKQPVTGEITFTGVGGLLAVTGETGNTQLVAEVVAVPAPPPPVGGGGSCTTKTATTFTIAGNFTVITKTLVP